MVSIMKFQSLLIVLAALGASLSLAAPRPIVEKVNLSPEGLRELSTHVVKGQVRAIYSQQREDTPLPVLPGATPSVIALVIDRAPTFSAWVIGVDGHKVFCGIEHPAGSDYRRPRDIWENVWLPLIAGANSTAAAIDNIEWFGGSGPTATIYKRGLLTRLAYLDYARFWASRDMDTTPNFTILWQPA